MFLRARDWTDDKRQYDHWPADQGYRDNSTDVLRGHQDSVSLGDGANDGVRHVHAAPPYPTVVAVKLSTISAPNGVAGFCGRSGLTAKRQEARHRDGGVN